MKLIRLAFYSGLGLTAGLLIWALMQLLRFLAEENPLPGMDTFIYEGALIGLVLGGLLPITHALWNHHAPDLILSLFALGAILGTVTGIICFGLGQIFMAFQFSPEWTVLFSFAILGLCLGGIVIYVRPSSGWPITRILICGFGSLAMGVFIEISVMYHLIIPLQLTGLLLGSLILFLMLSLLENFHVKSYLRVLTGSQEGQIYLLDQQNHSIGYGKKNDLILKGHSEVCEVHAQIFKKDEQIYLENTDEDGNVSINYRFINQQSVKKGDIIKLGSALLQYHEV
jgi:hypothetical protein